jgi:DNA-binding GntR family transcriptional regulator
MSRRGPRGPVPLYKLISDNIRADIQSGKLKAGQALPKELEICEEYNASRLTVRNALQILRDEELIYTLPGTGSFVGPEDAPQIRELWPFEKVAASIVVDIRSGKYKPDEALPSEAEMQELYGVARKTGRAAYAHLRGQGYVYTVTAIGTFVAKPEHWPAEA